MSPVNSKNQTKQNLKTKTFRSKLLELCKTTTKESRPDMFNFYADLVGHDMVIHTGKATKCRCKFKAPSLQTKSTKNEVPFETWVLTENNLKIQTKKTHFWHRPNNPVEHTIPKCSNWHGPSNQEEINCRKIEKSIQVETVGTLQD